MTSLKLILSNKNSATDFVGGKEEETHFWSMGWNLNEGCGSGPRTRFAYRISVTARARAKTLDTRSFRRARPQPFGYPRTVLPHCLLPRSRFAFLSLHDRSCRRGGAMHGSDHRSRHHHYNEGDDAGLYAASGVRRAAVRRCSSAN
jgi:hypothetical protein